MHYAVKESLPDAEVICAFDINTVANDVYEHNFGKRPYQVTKRSASCQSHLHHTYHHNMKHIACFADCCLSAVDGLYPLHGASMHIIIWHATAHRGAKHLQGNIEKLSSSKLDSYKADMWLLAPPCQPYTRRGLQKDADDWRASSFMKLLSKLSEMQAGAGSLLL